MSNRNYYAGFSNGKKYERKRWGESNSGKVLKFTFEIRPIIVESILADTIDNARERLVARIKGLHPILIDELENYEVEIVGVEVSEKKKEASDE